MPGPLPKRSDERTRRESASEDRPSLKKGLAHSYKNWPSPNKEWEQPVKELFTSLAKSGMEAFYEESDIAWARVICDGLDEWYKTPPGRRSAMKLDVPLKHAAALGITEGERRRMRIELETPSIPEESVGSRARKMFEQQLNQAATVTRIHPEKEEE